MRSWLFIAFACLCSGLSVGGQSLICRGEVVDAAGKRPVFLARIATSDQAYSTVSDTLGRFFLVLPIGYQRDFLVVSHISYQEKNIVFSSDYQEISLSEQIQVLPDMVVYSEKDVTHLMRKAIQKMSDNYLAHPYEQTGYTRQELSDGQMPVGFSEGVLHLLNGGLNAHYAKDKYMYLPSDIFFFEQFRQRGDQLSHEFSCTSVEDLLRIKKDVLHRTLLSEKEIDNFDFQLEKYDFIGSDPIAVIAFRPKNPVSKLKNLSQQRVGFKRAYSGTLYLNMNDFGIIKIRLSTRDYRKAYLPVALKEGFWVQHQGSDVVILFQKVQEKYVLQYVSLHAVYQRSDKAQTQTARTQMLLTHTQAQVSARDKLNKKYQIKEWFDELPIQQYPLPKVEEQPEFWDAFVVPISEKTK
ncbi:MAG: hypothetical protein ACFCUI_13335 [Bernardetiaceae bacterium]